MQSNRWSYALKGLTLIFALTLSGFYISCESRNADPVRTDGQTKEPDSSQTNADNAVNAEDPPSQPEPHKFEPEFDLNKALSKSSPIQSDKIVGDKDQGGGGKGLFGGDDPE